jgi:hypothetical protein
MNGGRRELKRALILSILCLLLLPASTFAQGRQRTSGRRNTQQKSRPDNTAQKTVDARTDGASRVADQIKNLTRFLYLLGGVSKGIETVDEAVRRNEASPTVVEQTEKSKAVVKTSLQNVREGLDKLEIDFRTTPELQRYYISLAGVAAGAANAEDQATAGHYDQAGRSLLDVVYRLTDVLLQMR